MDDVSFFNVSTEKSQCHFYHILCIRQVVELLKIQGMDKWQSHILREHVSGKLRIKRSEALLN